MAKNSCFDICKVRFKRPNKVFGAPKSFLGPPKTQEIDFLKNLNSVICPNFGFGFHSDPGDLGTIRPLETIYLT